MKLREYLLAGAAMLAASYLPVQAAPKATFGFTSLETAVTDTGDSKFRQITNLKVNDAAREFRYHGVNNFSDSNDTYFGRHMFMLGRSGKHNLGAVLIKVNDSGIIDTKLGFRNLTIPKDLGADAGFFDLTVDDEAANLTLKWIKKGRLKVEFMQDIEARFAGDDSYLNEFQFGYKLRDNLRLFYRKEVRDFDFGRANNLVGLEFQLR